MTIPEIENGVQTTNTLSNNLGAKITKFGIGGIYVAMTIIYLWFGGMKFTSYEANGIHGFVSNSPLLSWMYSFLSIQGFSNFLGVLEISVGMLIAARVFSPKLAILGGVLSTGLFTTLSFMLTTLVSFAKDLGLSMSIFIVYIYRYITYSTGAQNK